MSASFRVRLWVKESLINSNKSLPKKDICSNKVQLSYYYLTSRGSSIRNLIYVPLWHSRPINNRCNPLIIKPIVVGTCCALYDLGILKGQTLIRMNIKSDLKNIISEHLTEGASSIFMVKSLSIIDESAESKESLLAAADKVSKRIALFIDEDLATKVFDILRREIEKRELSPGIRRKHVRAHAQQSICDLQRD